MVSHTKVEQAVFAARWLVNSVGGLLQTLDQGSEQSEYWVSDFGQRLKVFRRQQRDFAKLLRFGLDSAFTPHAHTQSICGISGSNSLEIVGRLGQQLLTDVNFALLETRQSEIVLVEAGKNKLTRTDRVALGRRYESQTQFQRKLFRRLQTQLAKARNRYPELQDLHQFTAAVEQEAGRLLQFIHPDDPLPAGAAVLTIEDKTILRVLSDAGLALIVADIRRQAVNVVRTMGRAAREAGIVTLSETKIRERLPLLEEQGLVSRPSGKNGKPTSRKGVGITEKGRARLNHDSNPIR